MTSLLLAIDTAFERCSAGLLDLRSGAIVGCAEPEIGKGHAERLMGVVDAVLESASASYADIARIAVTVGPGSFTGLRVGVSAVRGLALALGVPAIGVTTLEALAAPHVGGGKPILCVLDAKRGEVYAALFSADGMQIEAPRALPPKALQAFVAGLSQDQTIGLVGTGAAIAAPVPQPRANVVLTDEARVDIAVLARLAAQREAGEPPRPLYLRGADAKPASATAGVAFGSESTPQLLL
ncbi:tRNA (adenosine(37)-N6)-threonylcarbamoyltransferase complex dimerization subunit type 1 TsaB [Aurantimonas sp. A3-2-R12]|uniref:tRNA (adenosine(37)-N6)-threonylcarbamoyltransferase complex dimerization subunit type 1 TsaB n=1 Tax=Aurantimonas sp. A3-2-R12 TaxID=3114362 RepID=UPI002E176D17|nr:tRNA (adenosine(37)-N6)-threonylcarbamoyltransferase complex dimerization subunit type 1 TsaB [Aurantimonas sp. A3-2-R12]